MNLLFIIVFNFLLSNTQKTACEFIVQNSASSVESIVTGNKDKQIQIDKHIKKIRSSIARIMLSHKEVSRWTSSEGSCRTLSMQLFNYLRLQGFKVNVVSMDNSTYVHYFIIDTTLGEDSEIIIDPTYEQYFSYQPKNNDVFVGTKEDVQKYFLEHRSKLQFASYNTLDSLYGFGDKKDERK